ncbi:proline--tRNA ligase [Paracoccus sp. (in: a-proteobacteria)]|uniref:proline--tRNA ligase n=1 Tax=Paracoccus sp. TaxID=267 RepID=UPI0026DFBEB2|nr:proline--tRNA ligase [Paracoccus sp. (in: a-proteobacteria)]MDO5648782.1 proline--tRNA ligase [Paracoccus sp. (in: a-proteobacteria)]
MSRRKALAVTRDEDFSRWFQDVITAAGLGEHSGVRGCMIMLPWGYAIWERIQRHLDDMIRATGHDNCYFPIFIPLELIEKEADHVDGFAKEMAVVTHHRLVKGEDGRLVPDGKLESPLIVRPTSEAMITNAFQRWIQSYRDLPVKINQWANVVRWEMRPRMFLRTSEFLWQEGHTAHATADEADTETRMMLDCYRQLAEDFMAIPVTCGQKSDGERFPGAVETHTIEAMMQDGRALQAGTSHNLGQNFATASEIRFLDRDGDQKTPYTTSWGVSTRLVGALIMVHSDDDGLRLPPRLAPQQVVIVPLLRDPSRNDEVMQSCHDLANRLRAVDFAREPLRVRIDERDMNPAEKRGSWMKKGVPVVVEIGPRDIDGGVVMAHRRDALDAGGAVQKRDDFVNSVAAPFEQVQASMFDAAAAFRAEMTTEGIMSFDDMKAFFEPGQGFVIAKWGHGRG